MKLRNGKFVDCEILGRWDSEPSVVEKLREDIQRLEAENARSRGIKEDARDQIATMSSKLFYKWIDKVRVSEVLLERGDVLIRLVVKSALSTPDGLRMITKE